MAAAAAILWMAAAMPARAARVVVMTPGTVAAALAEVQPGDTLRMEGLFTTRIQISNRDFGGVRVDASTATLLEGLQLRNVHNIGFDGGTIGSLENGTAHRFAVLVELSSHVSFANMQVLGNSDGQGTGMRILNSRFMTVRDSRFDGNVDGVQFLTTPDSLATNNLFVNSQADGIKIVDSQRVIASFNSCLSTTILPGAHPDCIQLWSNVGRPLQSDIYILNNLAIGNTQGFASFDPDVLSGTRLTFAGNYAALTYVHGVTCLGCTDSRFVDNILIALPEAMHRTLVIAPTGAGNIFENNQIVDLRGQFGVALPERILSELMPSIAFAVGSSWEDRSHGPIPAAGDGSDGGGGDGGAAVPEPASWAMLMVGFGLIGGQLRRRRGQRRGAAA